MSNLINDFAGLPEASPETNSNRRAWIKNAALLGAGMMAAGIIPARAQTEDTPATQDATTPDATPQDTTPQDTASATPAMQDTAPQTPAPQTAPKDTAPQMPAPKAPMAKPSSQRQMAMQSDRDNDLGILRFALTLERLEYSFYSQVVDADTSKQYLHGRLHELAPMLRDNEAAHVQAISATMAKLGGTMDAAPGFRFPREVFISPVIFARFAFTLETIGVGAYLGAVNQIRSIEIRRAAASIYGNEARHVALLRHLSGYTFSTRYYEGPLTVAEVKALITPYIAA